MDLRARALASASLFALLALVMQFLLGMAVNLFVTIPTSHPGAKPPEYFGGVVASVTWAVLQGPLLLQLHAGFGLVLVVGSVYLLIQGILMRRGSLVTATVFGFIGTLGAGFNGGSFLNYNENFSSMLMAAGFAVAVVAYLFALYLSLQVSPARQVV
ncbi:MAG: hypothetical protein ACR2MZ_08670 [Candidatus Dormibacter sp.]|uniref:hypothetical protein n=1 Tax=Candidatus Dormibacter sp. TaxID=2973982 RepID=UPI000DB37680|nr:MAG: hypothetical protein DLM66_08420 [Candidatus Dormibacteraeota bacterium]